VVVAPGGVEEGETVRAAALREVCEETGYVLGDLLHLDDVVETLPAGGGTYAIALFVAPAPASPPLRNDEHDAFRWGAPEEFFEQPVARRVQQSPLVAGPFIDRVAQHLAS